MRVALAPARRLDTKDGLGMPPPRMCNLACRQFSDSLLAASVDSGNGRAIENRETSSALEVIPQLVPIRDEP
jgi:hypothetical protein